MTVVWHGHRSRKALAKTVVEGPLPGSQGATRLPILGGGLGSREGWAAGGWGMRDAGTWAVPDEACWSPVSSSSLACLPPLHNPPHHLSASFTPNLSRPGARHPQVSPYFRELRWQPPASRDLKVRRRPSSGTATQSKRHARGRTPSPPQAPLQETNSSSSFEQKGVRHTLRGPEGPALQTEAKNTTLEVALEVAHQRDRLLALLRPDKPAPSQALAVAPPPGADVG